MNKYALLSVSDKYGIVDFAKGLVECGYKILSTGGTAKELKAAGVLVQEVGEFTGSPEILDGRVKTLHPKVHGGILNIRDNVQHQETIKAHGIENIDIVAVNLYPFEATVARSGVTFEEIIENIDIGGPSMVRSAAKNHAFVTIVVHSSDYNGVLDEIRAHGNTTKETRLALAAKAFSHTALYDSVISGYLNRKIGNLFPQEYTIGGRMLQAMRYGENPHQNASFYSVPLSIESGITNAKQLHGKELSFNNVVDAHAAVELAKEFKKPAAVIVKHMNPCGTAVAETVNKAYELALACDPVSAFGGIVAVNREIDEALAQELGKLFLEVIIAPSYSNEALETLTQKKNVRLLSMPINDIRGEELDFKKVTGGFLLQDRDTHAFDSFDSLTCPTKRKPTAEELRSLEFAWVVAKHVKSNAIIYVTGTHTIGVGAGQMSRVDSSRVAAEKAKSPLAGCVMASDAFFPFRDSVDEAASRGITAIVQPGGSIRDEEVIAAADEANIAMIYTGVRHFRH
ncbi:MAG: bifunctional phosphoribosylaminoimidazolecarboxamide formyltransferase/IMP cyclohydrolase [Deferribacteraceae bacterium]|jgi:phosphoribosylaminoimidazolecarboxamide formyltransferase/IMP cyclohydrolase|nr:bifunctional phosphoribosylaminoimidazolecarboxamide formyltransferase/IMP cyclohydrolase [Deferribacteraceae bacterium]